MKTAARKTTTKRTPTPAQLAARERFAEMARAGSFKKAGGRKINPAPAQTLTGPAVVRLMKQNKVTIPQLAERMNITQTRIRTVREKGVKGNEFVRDWIEGITGRDPYATNPARKAAGVRRNPAARKWLVVPRVGKYYIEGSFSTEQAAKDYLQTLNAPWNYKVKRAVAERAPRRASNPAMAPSTVYQVQYTKDGKAWAVWGTYDTAEKAKAIAKGGSDSIYPGMWWRVESIKVKA